MESKIARFDPLASTCLDPSSLHSRIARFGPLASMPVA